MKKKAGITVLMPIMERRNMEIRKSTWKHIRRSPYQSLAAVITMFLTFLLGGFVVLTTTASAFVLHYFESKPQITVFFNEKAGKPEIDALQKTLEDTKLTSSITFVSKEQALEIYKEQNKKDPLLLEMVTADILPASLEISALDPSNLKDLEPIIRKTETVEDVVYQKDVVDSLISWTNAIRLIGGVLAGLLALDSLLIVMTVISMKIALKKDEIDILKLVGASQWYIRAPFVIEGAVYGFVGAGLAAIVLNIIIITFREYILSFLGVVPSISALLSDPMQPAFILFNVGFFAAIALGGSLLGALGSLVSIGRYLKF
jgi:cell division transport system permease protein